MIKSTKASIEKHSDSLIEILSAQCSDLETLLVLAKRETSAAKASDFEEMMEVVGEREKIGERLQVYHRQISEMRHQLGDAAETVLQSKVARRTSDLVAHIQEQDLQTRPLLLAARTELARQIQSNEQGKRGVKAYLTDARAVAVACDQRI